MNSKDKKAMRRVFEGKFLNKANLVAEKYFINARSPINEKKLFREVSEIEANEKAIKAVLVENKNGFSVITDEGKAYEEKFGLVVTDKKDRFDVYLNVKSNILKANVQKSALEGQIYVEKVEGEEDVGLMFKHFQQSIKERMLHESQDR